jgi:hypothetical protein
MNGRLLDYKYCKCFKPDCMRKVSPGSRYCCHSCATAAEAPVPYETEPYDPAAHWILVHSKGCEDRTAVRGEFATRIGAIFNG